MNAQTQPRGEAPDAETQEIAHLIVDAASDKKAQDIVLLDVHNVTSLADYFVICSATSDRQMHAVAEGIEEVLDHYSITPLRREGRPPDGWIVLDFGDIVAHIFAPDQRAFYKLEEVWTAATTVVRVQ